MHSACQDVPAPYKQNKPTIAPMRDFESPQFRQSLAEVVAWCSARSLQISDAEHTTMQLRLAQYREAGILMTAARKHANSGWLRPKVTETEQWREGIKLLRQLEATPHPLRNRLRSESLKPAFSLDEFCSITPWQEAVAEVVTKRSALIDLASVENVPSIQRNGRLLLCEPLENVADGASEAGSYGFFDVNDIPPWDIWVEFSGNTLVSWVPEEFIGAAQNGIDANPVDCIHWAH